MKMPTSCLILLFILYGCIPAFSQDSTSQQISPAYLKEINAKTDKVEKKLDKQTLKALRKMKREELKFNKQLIAKDSLAAKKLFSNTENKYTELEAKFSNSSQIVKAPIPDYNSYLDTLKTSLQFLNGTTGKIVGSASAIRTKLDKTIGKVNGLDLKMAQAQNIQQLLKERRQYLKEQLSKFGMLRQMKKMNKQVYYYSQSIKEYKDILKDKKRMEKKALALLRKTPAFKKFMQQHSQFASLFGVPAANPGPVSFANLQTRASVQQLIQRSVPGGANPQQFLSQQIQSADQQAAKQRNAIHFPGQSENMGEMPDFKPNGQKTKSFLQRLEYGSNVQFGKVNRFLPATGEVAVSLGYKLNDNNVIGIGSSYKLGLGSSINHIRFSHQGYGLRSFIDLKLKGNLFISGGYEMNCLPQLDDIDVSQHIDTWQESGLVGLSKKYAIAGKRKGFVQLLFDFLSYKNMPRSQPLIFRTGINF